ncbi:MULTISPECIES: protein-disulfide reductase DsbD domain-containing protein [unclassified Afipia]|uniref:protein-disulfide reductase DsbD domain-containing protein n=1 Tax=unclassified Afipia TaxID=2642050 RepID=UPI0004647555|nr:MULTISPECIES: protein-disulfide reductase DsbD domain-containing protein [unclassified Afipia]MAH69446.1 cytochrome C biogenesis protein [Afipia sp.]OUX61437.1 MAG: cytochrome C biogenesis protein [Afipia sp. TMED4]HAO41746.1 cytochrome C biogenesis protein [Afipia sp.]HAP10253.1 cytochrome C biogenesis protein [Afipia sp.]HBF52760.1 cytochrome C biogenesis protein [Afipia sp.]
MTLLVPVRTVSSIAFAAIACLAPVHARADDASPWIKDTYSAVRLIAGSRSGNVLLGGIGFQLQPGWKTYWRTPGDSGVPPRIDFSKSDNIDSVKILWPVPMKFPDGAGGISFGYHNQLLLPLRIIAKSPDKPVTLRASISYAVCEKICIPVEANAELAFVSVASTEDSAIAAALETVPKPAKIGDATPIAIRGVRRDGKLVLVDVALDEKNATHKDKEVQLFAEGPTPDWALPVPKLIQREADGVLRFAFELDGLPPGATADGAILKLTVAGPGGAYEVNAAVPPKTD